MILSWQQIPSPMVSEILCYSSDGVVIDTEHGCFNNETIYNCIQIIKSSNKKCFVRLTEISNTLIRYCLDAGADGLIFSTVENEDQCEEIKKFSCFPPVGRRGLGLVRQNRWGLGGDLVSKDPILIPQIESKVGIENLDKICSYNFDYYLIGPYDLSMSINLAGKFDSEEFMCYINKVAKIIPQNKMAVHIPSDVPKQIEKYKNYGLKCLGMDTMSLIEFGKEMRKYA
tara:strand:- start:306 stop:989 length:684 start_codon:yes stop_codon:yes gene_type:complete